MIGDPLDFNNIGRLRVLDWPATCQVLLAALEHYQEWCREFDVKDGDEFRAAYLEDMAELRSLITKLKSFGTGVTPRWHGHQVKGVTVYDGDKP